MYDDKVFPVYSCYLQKYMNLKAEIGEKRFYTQSKEVKQEEGNIINRCPHVSRKYYAKGMCNLCYLSFGRSSLSTSCAHPTRMNYALKMCLECYHKNKHFLKRNRQIQKNKFLFFNKYFEGTPMQDSKILDIAKERKPSNAYSKKKP